MADWIEAEEPERPSARRAIRHALRQHDGGLVVVSEGFLAADSEIDLLGVGSEGELVSVRFAPVGEDAEGLVRCLSDLAWLRSRARGFHRLAPGLGIEASAEPRAVLLSSDFSLDALSAVENFPKRTLSLMRCRWLRASGPLVALLEPVGGVSKPRPPLEAGRVGRTDAHSSAGDPDRSPAFPATSPPGFREAPPDAFEFTLRTGFRTGLSEADLRRDAPDTRPVESMTSSD